MAEKEDGLFDVFAGSHFVRIEQHGKECIFFCPEKEVEKIWRPYFDMDTDYAKWMRKINPEDGYLKEAAKAARGLRILRQDFFETVITFIISQQNNIPRIRGCVERLCTEYGEEKKRYGAVWHAFPKAEVLAKIPEAEFVRCGLGYRARYIREASEQIVQENLCARSLQMLPDAEAKKRLLELTGVGTKVADCILLFSLHRTGAFPVDTHIRQVFSEHYPNGFPLARYDGFAGILQQYMFFGELKRPPMRGGGLSGMLASG